MAYNLEEISAKLEIQDLIYRYSEIIDSQDFDKLDEVFTADAHIDYSAMGGSKGNFDETVTFLKDAMPGLFPNSQHLNANMQITLSSSSDIASATGRIMCYNPMEMLVNGGPETKIMMCGLWYLDDYVNTDLGWKIKTRVEEKSWFFNM